MGRLQGDLGMSMKYQWGIRAVYVTITRGCGVIGRVSGGALGMLEGVYGVIVRNLWGI